MKKILHISKYYYPYFGGIEDVVHSIVTELRDKYEQRVICFNHEKSGTIRIMDDGIEIIRVQTTVTINSQPVSLSYLHMLRAEIEDFKPDVIHIHFPNPLIGFYLLLLDYNAKLVIHWHSDIIGKNYLYGLYRPLEKRILKRADVIITTSPQYIECSKPLQPFADKVQVLPNVVNEEKLQPQRDDDKEVARIIHRYKGKKIILYIGRHVPYKGIDLLVKAGFHLADDCVILIAGTGEMTPYLQRLAQPLGEKVQFIGRLQNKELRCYLRAASLFAFPSIDRREAFGLALAEALYCGLPAVSFYIEGSGSIWVNRNQETGIVVDQIDAELYAQAISSLLQDEEKRKQYGKSAKEWVKTHFLKNQIQKLLTVYESC